MLPSISQSRADAEHAAPPHRRVQELINGRPPSIPRRCASKILQRRINAPRNQAKEDAKTLRLGDSSPVSLSRLAGELLAVDQE